MSVQGCIKVHTQDKHDKPECDKDMNEKSCMSQRQQSYNYMSGKLTCIQKHIILAKPMCPRHDWVSNTQYHVRHKIVC